MADFPPHQNGASSAADIAPQPLEPPSSTARTIGGEGVRFIVVGIANTAIDVTVLWLLLRTGVPLIPANLVSTTTGLAFSFLVNRRFTFRFTGTKPLWRQVTEFAVVTLVGLWAIQPPIIVAVRHLLASHGVAETPGLLAGKIVATAVTVVWNFVLYRTIVFREPSRGRTS